LDDGADLIFTIHKVHPEFAQKFVIGGTEETTTGVHRLRSMAAKGALRYPVIAVNDAETKWDFDNVYGTGQSTLDGILRATSVLFAGKNMVVAGYGHCGRGVAQRAKGLGANVIVTEVKPTAALKATLEGFRVMKMDEAAKIGDIFVTATGVKDVIVKRHFQSMKDGAIVSNTGHYDCEINIPASLRKRRSGHNKESHKDGRRSTSRQRQWFAAAKAPSEVMDMSFATFMSHASGRAAGKVRLENGVHDIPTRSGDRA
jgi:adenosylhomocysteinase